MIELNRKQIEHLEKTVEVNFENRLFEHFDEFFPNHMEIMGDQQARLYVRYGIERARKSGFFKERDICMYISLMLLLGSHFASDPQIPWAGESLNDAEIESVSERIDVLYKRTISYLDSIYGRRDEYLKQVLSFLRLDPIHELTQYNPAQFEYGMQMLFRKVWWQKTEVVHQNDLSRLIHLGMKVARPYHISDICGTGLYISLMFIMGAGFDRDPQYPWARAALTGSSGKGDGLTTVEELHNAASDYLERWIFQLENKGI